MADLVAALRRPEMRLLTLTGPGGVGKTRLALRVAETLRPDFADGVGFIALAAVRDPALVLPAIARGLGIPEGDRHSLMERLAAPLAGGRCLLVLDNFEQVTNAAPELVELLGACPALSLLVTSRAPLHVGGEQVYPVPPMVLPDPGTGAEVVDAEAVRLFVARAEAVNPGVTLTEATRPAIAEICARLDGLPLAIELAAARSSLFAPPVLLGRLNQRLSLLISGPRDQPNRLQTMANAIEWSYDLLTAEEQALFRHLSVFVGGFSLTAAVAVSNLREEAVLMHLETLVDHSLVRAVAEVTDEPRYVMLETIREFGLHQLTATGEADEAQGRHARYFVALAEHIDPGVEGAEAGVLLGRLDLDRPNLQSALAWLIEQGEAEQALRLTAAQWRYWRVRGSLREGCDSLERSLALPGFVPPTIRAEAHWKLGVLLFHAGHYGSAREHLEHSIRLYDWCVDSVGLGAALNQLGTVLRLQRKFDLARQHHVRALAIHKSLDDYAGQEMSTAYLGMVALDRGDLSEGRHLLERSFAMAHELGSLRQIGSRSLNLARLELAEGRLPEAQAYVESIRTLAEETNDQLVSEMELEILGGIALSAGARTQAVNYLVQCLQLRLKLGLFLRINDIVEALAAAVVSFDAALAVRLLGAAASDREATGVPRLVRDVATYEDTLSLARGALEAGAFASAWRSGKGLTILAAAHEAETALAGLVEVEPDTAAELDRPSRVPNDLGLTSRELEVLQLVAKQLTNREIASELYLSPATVKRHVSNILGKMQVPSRTAAIARARVLGMVEPEP